MTVYKNIAFGLQLRKVPKNIIRQKVHETAKILDIEDLLNRKPKALSGGQRQRVALGRAMVRDPAVFLLDEPLSNLDAKLRTSMRTEISMLHKRLGTTFVYVTHDQTEAMTMGDRIVVMKDGFIQQVDSPQELYDVPRNLFVAGFIGAPQMNFIDAAIIKTDDGFAAKFGNTALALPKSKIDPETALAYEGKEVVLGIRAENLHVEATHMEREGTSPITVTVNLAELLGSETYLYGECEGVSLIAKIPPYNNPKPGETIKLALDRNKLHLFDKESGEAIR